MSVYIDYPIPGPVSSNIAVGGTYQQIGQPPSAKNGVSIIATLYNQADQALGATTSCGVDGSGNWNGSITIAAGTPTTMDCYLVAVPSDGSASGQINGLDYVSGAPGAGGVSSMTGP